MGIYGPYAHMVPFFCMSFNVIAVIFLQLEKSVLTVARVGSHMMLNNVLC